MAERPQGRPGKPPLDAAAISRQRNPLSGHEPQICIKTGTSCQGLNHDAGVLCPGPWMELFHAGEHIDANLVINTENVDQHPVLSD